MFAGKIIYQQGVHVLTLRSCDSVSLWGKRDLRVQVELKGPFKPGMVAHACNPSHSGGGGRTIVVSG
jgi:hypothetical protein